VIIFSLSTDLAALAGGSLSAVIAVGYGAGRGVGVWGPDAAIALGLILLNVGLRGWRRHRKLREWRRYHPEESMPTSQTFMTSRFRRER
jgi:hypothetical protein